MRYAAAVVALVILAASCGQAAKPDGELGERTHEAGAVTVVAQWIADGGSPTVELTLDTHSVPLDDLDLVALARLRMDGGAWIAPSSWDGAPGGHHRSGRLAFDALDRRALSSARVVELEIRDVGAPSHLLRWERSR